MHREAVARAESLTALDTLDAADAEDELGERLEQLGVPKAWELTEPLAAAGIDRAWIDRVAAVAGPATDAAVEWVAATLTARSLALELQQSTQQMSKLVGAVKSYAYMDRGDLVEIDLHEGLETTLTVLGHKLKHRSIKIVRDYDRSLPKLTVRGSELNQVWTNLLDNAIDALGESGTITITTEHDGSCARVDISDDGPGIPADIRERVFDSFFTTKDIGSGTGLGLATARRIVVDRHDGSLTLDSRAGTYDVPRLAAAIGRLSARGAGFVLRQRALDRGQHLGILGRGLGRPAGDQLAVGADQILGEVPGRRPGSGLAGQISPQRRWIGPDRGRFGEGELDAVVLLAE